MSAKSVGKQFGRHRRAGLLLAAVSYRFSGIFRRHFPQANIPPTVPKATAYCWLPSHTYDVTVELAYCWLPCHTYDVTVELAYCWLPCHTVPKAPCHTVPKAPCHTVPKAACHTVECILLVPKAAVVHVVPRGAGRSLEVAILVRYYAGVRKLVERSTQLRVPLCANLSPY